MNVKEYIDLEVSLMKISEELNKKVTDYVIAEGYSVESLKEDVVFYLKRGWQPYGSVAVGEDLPFIQPMVKYEVAE